MLILGIETSCDETSVALVRDGRHVLACEVSSQTDVHQRFGGVVPELASRAHLRNLFPLLTGLLGTASVAPRDIDAIAVTAGPGLVGALIVGVEAAKALAYAWGKPLLPVHHIEGHLYSVQLAGTDPRFAVHVLGATEPLSAGFDYPYIGLVVSGGHSSLVRVDGPATMTSLGETVDDAAGEAFDKLAKLLGLGYPGGPLVEAAARAGDPARFDLPRPLARSADLRFSFSGLKTAAARIAADWPAGGPGAPPDDKADLCASFQRAVADVLLAKSEAALHATGTSRLAIVGGVACNGALREAAAARFAGRHVAVPAPFLCTDNAAMIAGRAFHGRPSAAAERDLRLDARARAALGTWTPAP